MRQDQPRADIVIRRPPTDQGLSHLADVERRWVAESKPFEEIPADSLLKFVIREDEA